MSDEYKFWLGCWAIVAVVLIAMMAACASNGYHQRSVLQDMVAKGANPMVASCALNVGQNEIGVCTLLAAQSK